MSRYLINGGKPLSGEVSIRGAKNASFKQLIASMLSSHPVKLFNIPQISDVNITLSIAKNLGAKITTTGDHSLTIETENINHTTVPHGTGEKSRTSFMFAAPLLARAGSATIPVPGGDKLGARPLDRLFDCYRQMGITTEEKDDLIIFRTDKIKGTTYTFTKPSHTVTEVLLMTASLANGETVLNNAALEPEIDDLIILLNKMGAKIVRPTDNPRQIVIQGVPWLTGASHQVISDRNETVTFACAALATKGSINILRVDPKIIETFLKTIENMGAKVSRGIDEVTVSWEKPLKAVDIETQPEPGFMTDWQAVFSVVLTQAIGCSSIVERIFPFRFHHIANLEKMGVKTTYFNPEVKNYQSYYEFNQESDKPEYFHGVKIYGPAKLTPANLTINDLRTGASATLAALTAQGQTTIEGTEFIERGYERLADRLRYLGADIDYVKT